MMDERKNLVRELARQHREKKDAIAKVHSVLPYWIDEAKPGDMMILQKGKGGRVYVKHFKAQTSP